MDVVFWAAAFLMVYSYVLYPGGLWLLTRWLPEPTRPRDAMLPSVTAVTAALNEEGIIAEKVQNFLGLEYPPDRFDALIGSDGSTDRTAERGRDAAAGSMVEIVEFPERRGKAAVIHDLVTRARGDVVFMSDANTIVDEHALERLTRWFDDPEVGCVCGMLKLRSATLAGKAETAYWDYETWIKRLENRVGAVLGANGGIYAFRRSLYRPIEPDTITDDFVLPLKIRERGYRIVFDDGALAWEDAAPTHRAEFRRRIRIGAGNLQALTRTRSLLLPSAGWTAVAYWSHKVLRWAGPFLLLPLIIVPLFRLSEPLYALIASGWVLVTASTVAAWILDIRGRTIPRPLAMLYAFLANNAALLIGAVKFLRGRASSRWTPTPRTGPTPPSGAGR